MSRRIFSLSLMLVVLGSSATAFPLLKRKKKAQTTQTEKKSAYERALTEHATESCRGAFVSLHKTDGKILVELPQASLGRDMLIGATISSVSNPKMGDLGFKNSNLVHVRFVEKDSSVVMQVVNTDLFIPKNSPSASIAARLNYDNLDFFSFPIKARSAGNASVLFDASSFFLKEDRFFPIIAKNVGSYSVSSSLKENLSRITALKVFERNACIKMDRHYLVSLSGKSGTPISNYPVTIGVNFTLALLPSDQMTPRLSDTRVGMFLINKDVLANDGSVDKATFVKRWRIEPKDTAAYFSGTPTEPVKPIVFYVENTFPPLWKRAIKAGILWWNKAFERIGFKNVMQVADFPTDNPDFDPDNFAYSCIRYLPTDVENAMGPSWTDPRTGEIINATVLVYNDVVNTIDNWRLVQTAQLDPAARAAQMPDSIVEQTLEYIIAHEVGHTLGFMHNMAASAAIPTDSLRSPTFTRKHGTTASIMDYARFNYGVQPGDKGVSFDPPTVGTYDKYAIEWTYKYFPDTKGDLIEESKRVSALIDKHAHDPEYRYGVQQMGDRRYDPSAIEEDLSNDPVKASTLGLSNLRYILSHLGEWFPNDDEAEHRATLYEGIANQAMRYVSNVFLNVPGIYLYQTSEASGLPRYKVVPKAEQRASAMWLLDQAVSIDSMRNEPLEHTMSDVAADSPFVRLGALTRAMAIRNIANLNLSYYLDSTSYSPLEYADDVYARVFAKTEQGKENLSFEEKQLQDYFVRYLIGYASDLAPKGGGRSSLSIAELTGFAEPTEQVRTEGMTDEEFISLLPQQAPHICSYAPSSSADAHGHSGVGFLNFGKSYGEPEDLFTNAINTTESLYLPLLYRTQELLRRVAPKTADATLRQHYEFLLRKLDQITK